MTTLASGVPCESEIRLGVPDPAEPCQARRPDEECGGDTRVVTDPAETFRGFARQCARLRQPLSGGQGPELGAEQVGPRVPSSVLGSAIGGGTSISTPGELVDEPGTVCHVARREQGFACEEQERRAGGIVVGVDQRECSHGVTAGDGEVVTFECRAGAVREVDDGPFGQFPHGLVGHADLATQMDRLFELEGHEHVPFARPCPTRLDESPQALVIVGASLFEQAPIDGVAKQHV